MSDTRHIRFFSPDDLAGGYALKAAESIILDFKPNIEITDVNYAIELYNIKQFFVNGLRLKDWTDEHYSQLENIVKQFDEQIGRFFGQVANQNILEYISSLDIMYIEDFWTLISKYKCFLRILKETFTSILQEYPNHIRAILEQKNLVQNFDSELTLHMCSNENTAELLISEILSADISRHKRLFFPSSLTGSKKEKLIIDYIHSKEANPNYLQLVAEAQTSEALPLSDKTKLEAQNIYDAFAEQFFQEDRGIKYGVAITFSDTQTEPYIISDIKNGTFAASYSISWIVNNQDYPTLLNNFIYIFRYVDLCFRSRFVSLPAKLSTFERYVFSKSKKSYTKGIAFDIDHMLYSAQMLGYYKQLLKLNIRLENIFKWFFEEYLPAEYHVEGFTMNIPSEATTFLEKCKLMATEIDRVLKQYKLYIEDGVIAIKLLEMSSEHVVFGSIPSMIEKKYIYPDGNNIQNCMFLLFSDQSGLAYTKKTKTTYSDLFSLLHKEKMNLSDFEAFQKPRIEWLLTHNCLHIDSAGTITLNLEKCTVLKDLFGNLVGCKSYLTAFNSVLEEMYTAGEIRYISRLFSEPEQSYLNYVLNKSEFCDGKDLRNKYIHGTHSQDPAVHKNDYLEFLKIFVLIIIKIDEEFRLRERSAISS